MPLLNRRHFLIASAATTIGGSSAAAAEFPERPITIIIPFAAGGAGDTIIRVLSPVIERQLGQPLVIDNRATGGGGMIGAQAVAKAAPDGHTLLLGATHNFVINQFLFPKVSLDPLTAFALITKVADVPLVLYASLSAPPTLAEFIARAKANPSKLSYGSPSVGSTPHLSVERLKQLTGIELVHIPYRGAPPAMQALMADEVQLYLAGWGVGKAQVEAKRVQALAIASPGRVPGVPLPTAIESGVPDYVSSNWWGLAAPNATPQPVIDKIYRAVTTALSEPAIRQRLEELGFVPNGKPPQTFLQESKAEAQVWAETISRGKLAIE